MTRMLTLELQTHRSLRLCSFFFCSLSFSLSFRLGSFYLSIFWVTAFFCLHHSAEPTSWFLYFGNCIIQFWNFLLALLYIFAELPPASFFKPRHSSGKEESSSYLPNLLLTPPWWGCWDAWLYLGGRRYLIYPWSLLAWVVMWPQVFFPVVLWLSDKESTCHAGDTGDTRLIPGSGRSPWKRACQLTPVFGPGKFHGQRSLVGYSP